MDTKTKSIKVEVDSYGGEYAQSILRSLGLDEYHKYMDSFKEEVPEEMSALPRLQIFDNLELLKETIPACIPDDTRKEDIKEINNDKVY